MEGFEEFISFLRSAPTHSILQILRSNFAGGMTNEPPVEVFQGCMEMVSETPGVFYCFYLGCRHALSVDDIILCSYLATLITAAVEKGYLQKIPQEKNEILYIPTAKIWVEGKKIKIKNIYNWFHSLERPWIWFTFNKAFEGENIKALLTSKEPKQRRFAKLKMRKGKGCGTQTK